MKVRWFFIFGVVALSGCSVITNFYIRNLTNEATSITLTSLETVDSKHFEFSFTNADVKKIQFDAYKKFEQTIVTQGQGNIIKISLPPNSTLYLGHGNNFHQMFEKAIIRNDTLKLDQMSRFKKSRQLINKYAIWFDIE